MGGRPAENVVVGISYPEEAFDLLDEAPHRYPVVTGQVRGAFRLKATACAARPRTRSLRPCTPSWPSPAPSSCCWAASWTSGGGCPAGRRCRRSWPSAS